MTENQEPDVLLDLARALRQRLEVIADHAWRDRDPAGHLAALQAASESITNLTALARPFAPPPLRHYLTSQSYDKALAFLVASGVDGMRGGE